MPILYALLTIFAWGIWLIPSQNVKFSGQQVRTFYVSAANLLIAGVFAAAQGFGKVTANVFWLPFLGGMVWSLGGWAAFAATDKLGVVRAYGIWAPLNIIVSLVLGAVLLHEFVSLTASAKIILFGSVTLIIAGVLLTRSFTLSQLALVVNALCGIYLLKDPKPNTRAAYLALAGCGVATIGAIALGRIK